ncbi:MAG: methyltransferase domain-containing protein [Pedosphaera sp.]|nr:methyltransferase domain-containing protein [Pedosphaera sp.]
MNKKLAVPNESTMSKGLRRYLYFSASITGAAIMIIEILGAKMLAPFVGTSHFVWTAQIAVTLVALATGYYVGGRWVDGSRGHRLPALGRLYACILLAAIYLTLTIVVVEPVAYWCLQFQLAMGSLLASSFLFFVPLALLAMTGPFLVRVLTTSLETVGGNIGRLTAISTLGSVVGTVLIGYVLIPFLPNSMTMYLTAGSLMALVAGYFLVWARSPSTQVGVAMGIALGLLLGYGGTTKENRPRFTTVDELYRTNSNFGILQVVQNKRGDKRFYLNDYLVQNTYDPIQRKSMAIFTYLLHGLAHAYTPRLQDVLCIGLGVGIVPSQFAREGIKVDVVEINPAVVEVAEKFFDCEIGKLNLTIGDGRYAIRHSEKQYDAIVLDAFLGDASPSHLMSKEAFQGMQRILRTNGTLVINSFGDFTQGRDFFTASLDQTLRSVFRSVRIHAAGNGNVFFVASDQRDLQIIAPPDFQEVHSSCRQSAQDALAGLPQTNPKHGVVISDNYNPVEFYDAPNREEHRRSLARYIRSL